MNKEYIWNFWAKYYEGLWVQKYSLGPTRREILNYLKEKLSEDKIYKILDVGCGTGQLLIEIKGEFAKFKLELQGVDFSREMLQQAKAKDSTINYQRMDVRDISNLEEKFDFILCTHSFPYYKDQPMALRQFKASLKAEGYLLLAQASQNTLYDQLVMSFVRLTTGKAKYPSVKSILEMTQSSFECERIVKIKERFFMPSIYLFILAKRNQGE